MKSFFFCMSKHNDSPKSVSPLVGNDTNTDHHNNLTQNGHHQNQTNRHISVSKSLNSTAVGSNHQLVDDSTMPPILSYRYVLVDFRAEASDEIDVFAGDLVIYEFTTSSEFGHWAHVLDPKTIKRGFVPSDILSRDPSHVARSKRKLPRSNADSTENQSSLLQNHHHQNNLNHSQQGHHNNLALQQHRHHLHQQQNNRSKTMTATTTTATVQGLFQEFNNNIHSSPGAGHHARNFTPQRELTNKFTLSNSLQDSTGRQTMCKFHDSRSPLCPQYCNLRSSDLDVAVGPSCVPFRRSALSFYVMMHNFVAREENDLNVRPGEFVELLNQDDPDWFWVRRLDDRNEGFVPAKFVCDCEEVKRILNKENIANSMSNVKEANGIDSHLYINQSRANGLPP